jgi:succinate dehydrogenase/fumarate reductase flavoprotein subunit
MSHCLQAQAEKLGVEIVDNHPVVEFIAQGEGDSRRIVAMLCIDRARANKKNPGLSAFVAQNWVLAAGGPGELYHSSVYPRGQYGIHAAAFLAGLEACNLTESQYGLASTKFRWNVSGTYMQVIPRIYSTDADGKDEREFLTEYFADMASMATNIFLKGYQWPFDAQRITEHRSSLVDMAVHQETVVRGRRVWMDFLRNPVGRAGWDEFRIDALSAEAQEYLRKTGALQKKPIQRLEHMNPPAIEIYAENKIDLYREPLEIAVCAQHQNGGFCVDKWWQSNIPGTFVIGEMAGTHGVKRPGGSALNAGQVGAFRAAEYIANVRGTELPAASKVKAAAKPLAAAAKRAETMLAQGSAAKQAPAAAMDEIRRRMTRFGAHLRSERGAAEALDAALKQFVDIERDGLKVASPAQLHAAVTVRQQCLTQIAQLKAICALFERGAGSRGSHCILADDGVEMHPALVDPATQKPYRFRNENESLRNSILCLRYNPKAKDLFDAFDVAPRPIPHRDVAFEVTWTQYRNREIYDE